MNQIQPQRITTIPKLAPRPTHSNKGMYGHVLVVAGSRPYTGAPTLTANAALRSGAGLVTLAVPDVIQQTVMGLCPCATSLVLDSDATGGLAESACSQVMQALERISVLAVGPGMGTQAGATQMVRALLAQELPVVLDADGLNNLLKIDDWPALRQCPLVLTPHPGEFSRMTGQGVADIQASRESSALSAVGQWLSRSQCPQPLVLVLKGEGSVVTDGRRVFINSSGNPGMATGGTGDVLTGVIAALIAQHLEPFDAACLGVHVHGRSGDLAAEPIGQVSMIATDLIDFLPEAFKQA